MEEVEVEMEGEGGAAGVQGDGKGSRKGTEVTVWSQNLELYQSVPRSHCGLVVTVLTVAGCSFSAEAQEEMRALRAQGG